MRLHSNTRVVVNLISESEKMSRIVSELGLMTKLKWKLSEHKRAMWKQDAKLQVEIEGNFESLLYSYLFCISRILLFHLIFQLKMNIFMDISHAQGDSHVDFLLSSFPVIKVERFYGYIQQKIIICLEQRIDRPCGN